MTANRREFLAGSAAAAVAAATPISDMPRYEGVHYQSWTPDTHPHFTLIQRFDRRGSEPNIVGVSIGGGPWQFLSDAEAKTHVQAIWDAAMVETKRVHLRHAEGAERSIALHKELGLDHDPEHIRAEHKVRADWQIATYHGHVKEIMAERRLMIGRSHPRLAIEINEKVMRDRTGTMV